MDHEHDDYYERTPKGRLTRYASTLASQKAQLELHPEDSPQRGPHEQVVTETVRAMVAILNPFAETLLATNQLTRLQAQILQRPEKSKPYALTIIKRGFIAPGPLNAMDLVRQFGKDLRESSPEIDAAYQLLVDLGEIPPEGEEKKPPPTYRRKRKANASRESTGRERGLDRDQVARRLKALEHDKPNDRTE